MLCVVVDLDAACVYPFAVVVEGTLLFNVVSVSTSFVLDVFS